MDGQEKILALLGIITPFLMIGGVKLGLWILEAYDYLHERCAAVLKRKSLNASLTRLLRRREALIQRIEDNGRGAKAGAYRSPAIMSKIALQLLGFETVPESVRQNVVQLEEIEREIATLEARRAAKS